jgi:hypothetical protein
MLNDNSFFPSRIPNLILIDELVGGTKVEMEKFGFVPS